MTGVPGWLRRVVARGDREVLVSGTGLAPLVAMSHEPAVTVALLTVFGAVFAASAAILYGLRYQITALDRIFWIATVTAFTVAIGDRLLAAWAWPLADQAGLYVGVIALNCLLVDRLERLVTDELVPDSVPLERVGRASVTVLATTFATVVIVVGVVSAMRIAASDAGGRLLDTIGLAGPDELAFFKTPGGALICLGLALALLRHLGDLDDDSAP